MVNNLANITNGEGFTLTDTAGHSAKFQFTTTGVVPAGTIAIDFPLPADTVAEDRHRPGHGRQPGLLSPYNLGVTAVADGDRVLLTPTVVGLTVAISQNTSPISLLASAERDRHRQRHNGYDWGGVTGYDPGNSGINQLAVSLKVDRSTIDVIGQFVSNSGILPYSDLLPGGDTGFNSAVRGARSPCWTRAGTSTT